jgi:hypothetical protein
MNSWGIKAIFALLVCISGVLLIGNLTWAHNWGGDFAAYIMQAKSISEFAPAAFVEANRFTIEQSSHPLGPIAYPWGFPVLLAPLYRLFGLTPIALKAVNVVSWLLFLLVIWMAFRKSHPASMFLLLVSIIALNPVLLSFSNNILSDLPFLLVSTFCLSLIQRVVVQDRRLISPAIDLLIVGIVIAFAFFIRTNGAILLLTLAISHLISSIQKASFNTPLPEQNNVDFSRVLGLIKDFSLIPNPLYLIPYTVFFIFVAITNWILPDGGLSHLSLLKGISVGTVLNNLHCYLGLLSEFFFGTRHSSLIYGATIPLAIAGAVRRYRTDYPAIVYVVVLILFQITWPYNAGLRYLFPILPFYLSFTMTGLEGFWDGAKSLDRALRKMICLIPVLLIIFHFGLASFSAAYWNIKSQEVNDGPFAPKSQKMFSYVANNTTKDSVIVFFKPRVMRLMTGRKSIMINKVEQLSLGDYLCLYTRQVGDDQVSSVEIQQLIEQKAALIVYENEDFKLYRLRKISDYPPDHIMDLDANPAALDSKQ